ncbi:unnamed protein product [Brassica rapa]|uniref:Uncharacterized protein n=1 Tax=Brassica campestris TaxID=3711 RepID=A0A8D9GCL0_BRACM|nr:unnamed protein product [Brassica rapa]
MQPACAQVSAKSILMGALKPKRVFIHPFSTLSLHFGSTSFSFIPSVRLASIIPH